MNPVCFPFTDDTGKEMRDLMSQQTELLAAIAAGNASAEFIDASFGALLDGTNTTKVFWLWWPLSATGGASKYDRLCRFFAMMAKAGYKLAYTLRFYLDTVSSDYTGTPLDDLADGRSAAPLVTDTTTDVTDWAEEDLMTWYIRGNALSLADGTMNILALEGEREFDITGETAPVYCFSLALCLKEWEDASYMYNSWRTYPGNGYVPMAGDVAPDGTMRVMTWHPAYCGGLNTKGGMTSGIGKPPMVWVSANAGIPLARKTTTYEGLWNDCDQQFALSAWRLRHWTKSNSGKLEGCTSYNYQYTPAVAEANVKRVVLTTAQAANILPGSGVCLGERSGETSPTTDRNQSYNHNIFNWAKVVSVTSEVIGGVEYGIVNLDLTDAISPTTTMLLSTMPWPSGTTECLPGHSDGCMGNLTNGKYPYRVAGVEMQIGNYTEQLDPLWQASLVDDHWHYDVYSCRDSEKQAGSITANYEKTSSFDLPNANKWSWNYIRALNKLAAESMNPVKFGGSDSTYVRAAFDSPGSAGLYAPWRSGLLYDYGACGIPCACGRSSPANSAWSGSPRLAGSGKKRGEWVSA